jgi:hypothetical protein
MTGVVGTWYWKSIKSVARSKPLAGTKLGKVQVATGFAGGLLTLALIRFSPDHVGWLVAGAAVGFFAMFGVVMSPLFWVPAAPQKSRKPALPIRTSVI